MNRKTTCRFQVALFVLLAVSFLLPLAARAQPNAVNVTARFRSAGVDVNDLLVYQISGVILIRGTTSDRTKAEAAGTVARHLGYQRVANLIELTEPSDDTAIVRTAEGSLSQHRSLDGCTFHIHSLRGVVHVEGNVGQELQRDSAIDLLRRIKGVTEVHSDLTVL